MTPPLPLSVDPDRLGQLAGQLMDAAGQLPTAPAPFTPAGSDPLSLAIIGQIPAVDGPPMTELPLLQAQSTTTAQTVAGAAQAYSTTDQQLGGQINKEMNPSSAPGTGSGGADSMGQMMQMAGQMGQMPMQVIGAVAAVPQAMMQGVQQVGQQVGQMSGQGGGLTGPGGGVGGTSGQGGPSGQGDAAGGKGELPGVEMEAEQADDQRPESGSSRDDREKEPEGAAAGQSGIERVPEAAGTGDPVESDSHAAPPGRHRLPEPTPSGDGINL